MGILKLSQAILMPKKQSKPEVMKSGIYSGENKPEIKFHFSPYDYSVDSVPFPQGSKIFKLI